MDPPTEIGSESESVRTASVRPWQWFCFVALGTAIAVRFNPTEADKLIQLAFYSTFVSFVFVGVPGHMINNQLLAAKISGVGALVFLVFFVGMGFWLGLRGIFLCLVLFGIESFCLGVVLADSWFTREIQDGG